MKKIAAMFSDSAKEFGNVFSLCLTAVFIAVSMGLEMLSVDVGFKKINFAFLAIAVIGMLFGPSVGFVAGLVCDLVGFMVHPSGSFLPIYTIVAGLQGMIYGICLYPKGTPVTVSFTNPFTKKKWEGDILFLVRVVAARLLDVVIINLVLNTALNMHYGFIPKEAFHVALAGRLSMNMLELLVDIPLLIIVLPLAMATYRSTRMRTKRI
ncbi:MAG: folate family ECF transporter S component [Oscillospiraceae bacterium]|nr:folate family ECF transporter S component [Oscillospiraceae bacterium]